jgi:hypothetical protein
MLINRIDVTCVNFHISFMYDLEFFFDCNEVNFHM